MSGFSVNAGGSWRKAKGMQVFTGGTWRKAKAIWVNTGGQWRKMSFKDELMLEIQAWRANEFPPEYAFGFQQSLGGSLTPNTLSNGAVVTVLSSLDADPNVLDFSFTGNVPRANYTIEIPGYGTIVGDDLGPGPTYPINAPGIHTYIASRLYQTIPVNITIN